MEIQSEQAGPAPAQAPRRRGPPKVTYLPVATSRAPRLANLEGVRVEMARIYNDMKSGRRAPEEGSRLVYVLSQIAKVLELTEIERRLILLEQMTDGKQLPAPARYP